MPLPDLQNVKEYLKIDGDEENTQIQEFIDTAVEELEDSGIKDQSTVSYGMAIKLLVAGYYEERRPQVIGT
ncbi:head-tail connector protein, partial [Gracilibacillus lacisalsi]